MSINATIYGQLFFVINIVVIFFTVKQAKGKADNIPLVTFYAILANFLFPPLGWLYLWYWSRKPNNTFCNGIDAQS